MDLTFNSTVSNYIKKLSKTDWKVDWEETKI